MRTEGSSWSKPKPPTLHLIRHLHMPPCDFGASGPPPLLEPPVAATAPLSWGSCTVLELPSGHPPLDEPLRVISITAPSAFLDHVREAWGGTGSEPLPVRASPPPALPNPVTARRIRDRPAAVPSPHEADRRLQYRSPWEMDTGMCWGSITPEGAYHPNHMTATPGAATGT